MQKELSALLLATIERERIELSALPESSASLRAAGADSWSPKEEIGHLIDSASNNHLRIVRAALEPEFRGPTYAQNEWVTLHGYQEMAWDKVVDFWFSYNSLLAVLVARIPAEKLTVNCFIGSEQSVPLAALIEDYILHMQHHVDHALSRENVTRYPSLKTEEKVASAS